MSVRHLSLEEARVDLHKRLREAKQDYQATMAPAWEKYNVAKAKNSSGARYDLERRQAAFDTFCLTWFPATAAFRHARDKAEQAFRQATGLEPWERFSDEPFWPDHDVDSRTHRRRLVLELPTK